MRRRTLLLTAAAVIPLAGCGFALRQAPHFAFTGIYLAGPAGSSLGQELRRNLASNPELTVVVDAKQIDKAQVVFEILQEAREKQIVAYNSAGLVREYQLRLRFRFRLRKLDGDELIPSSEILQQRSISFNESVALSKEVEEQLLYREMQTDIVQQTLRRLAALKAL